MSSRCATKGHRALNSVASDGFAVGKGGPVVESLTTSTSALTKWRVAQSVASAGNDVPFGRTLAGYLSISVSNVTHQIYCSLYICSVWRPFICEVAGEHSFGLAYIMSLLMPLILVRCRWRRFGPREKELRRQTMPLMFIRIERDRK